MLHLGIRRSWIVTAVLIATITAHARQAVAVDEPSQRPNVLLIMTDDQGYGDLGCHGNPKIRTPNLDRLARESVRLKTFCVSPVCSPTRSSLMTGRYHFRTGVVDTYLGRSMMHPDEVTLAEMLGAAGYRTGIFGKWHLGDNVPLRATDQGFQRALVIKGGGIAQPSDPPGGGTYLDPVLQDQNQSKKFQGYCSDVFTDAAIAFINAADDRPFFAYVPYNCPHSPLQAPRPSWIRTRTSTFRRPHFHQLATRSRPIASPPRPTSRRSTRWSRTSIPTSAASSRTSRPAAWRRTPSSSS